MSSKRILRSPAKRGSGDNVNKFVEMFERRVAKGQHFHQPYFGCREFVAEVLPADNPPPAIAEDRHLGIVLWDIAFGTDTNAAIFFDASLRHGVLEVPPDAESALATLHAGTGGAA
jgi:CRISPR-associated protein Cas5d